MRNPMALILGLASILAGPTGCANTTKNVTKPSEYHRMAKRPGGAADAHAMAYDGRGRGAYLKVDSTDQLIKLCAEPAPDVTANLEANSELSGTLKVLAEYELFKASVDGEMKRSQAATSSVADAATRTELVLFMRDALYRVCEMNFNGVLSEEQARKAFSDVIAAGRVLGQRDNVGKLIELANSLMAAKQPDPALIHDVIGTIRFLAASDYLLAGIGDEEDSDMVARLLITEVLGSNNIAEARRLKEDQIRAGKERIAELEKQIKELEKQIKELRKDERNQAQQQLDKLRAEREFLIKEQEKDIQYYESVFGVPPTGTTIGGPADAGDTIE